MHALRLAPAAVRMIVALVVSAILLAAAAIFAAAPTSTPKATAMSAECRQAYEGYASSTDPEESDFWAESWMSFGCESGGYWA